MGCMSSAGVGGKAQVDLVEVDVPEEEKYTNPASFIPILKSGQVALLDPEYIIELHHKRQPIKRRQDLPDKAFISVTGLTKEATEKLLVISISYCWLSKDHPDPNGYHLMLLAACLKCFCRSSFESGHPERRIGGLKAGHRKHLGWIFGAADASSVGVFLDFCSLFQKPFDTDDKQALFNAALKDINLWYAHQRTIVWMFTAVPADVKDGYAVRGWPSFEKAISEMISPSHFLLEFSEDAREQILRQESGFNEYSELVINTMSKSRPPPTVPAKFNELLDIKVFTNGADKDIIVIPKYRDTFEAVVSNAKALKFSHLQWEDKDADALMNVVNTNCKFLQELDLSENNLTKPPSTLFDINLKRLDLHCLQSNPMAGELKNFAVFSNLMHLDLLYSEVTGEISDISGLANLVHLSLGYTPVTGDISSFARLPKLEHLSLLRTNITGNISVFKVLTELNFLDLTRTSVEGDISCFSRLAKLNKLNFYGCIDVVGDISVFTELTAMKELRLDDTKVEGDISCLTSLVNLDYLSFFGCANVIGGTNIDDLRRIRCRK